MKDIKSITTEVAPSSFEPLEQKPELKAQEFIDNAIAYLSREEGDAFIAGCAKQGKKPAESISILRDSLYKEIESLKFSKDEDDNNIRLATSQIRKSLKTQVDSIITVLNQSVSNNNNFHYILGQALKALSEQ